jgi:hypothetical protein
MAPRFGTLCDDGVHARALEGDRFLDGRRGADEKHAARLDGADGLLRQETEREAERRGAGFEGGGELRLEVAGRRRRGFGLRKAELEVVGPETLHGARAPLWRRGWDRREEVDAERAASASPDRPG